MISREELLTHLDELDRRRADADARSETVLARWESAHPRSADQIPESSAAAGVAGDITLRSARHLHRFRSHAV